MINVIGAGRWGPNLIRSFSSNPAARVGLVCDLDAEKLERLRMRYPGLRMSRNPGDALADPAATAVAIVTPVATHFELASQALRLGKDVLVEKPIAASSAEAAGLVELARHHGRILMVGHIFEYNVGINYVRQLLGSGELGRVVSIHARRTNLGPVRSDVNALWDLGAHDLSVFSYWLGNQPLDVSATGICHLGNRFEDTVLATYRYPGGILASVHVSWLHPQKTREIVLVGETKMVVWDDMDLGRPVTIYDKGFDGKSDQAVADSFGAHRLSIREGAITIPSVRGPEPLEEECRHFIQCVTGRIRPRSDGIDGLRVVQALEAADESMRRHGAFVALPTIPDGVPCGAAEDPREAGGELV